MALELEERGFDVRHFADAVTFLPALDQADDTDVIIIDWHLPKSSGAELLATIRRRGINVPVVVLTGRGIIPYENQAFQEGATDFVDKSKGVEILVRRLKRAANDIGPPRVSIHGKLNLYRRTSRAEWNGLNLDLTLGEYNTVELLVRNAGHYVCNRTIYDIMRTPCLAAGDGPEGYRVNVRSAIRRVRNKFRAVDPLFDAIDTYTAFGYRWRIEGN